MLLMITTVMMVLDGDDEAGDSGDDHDGTVMMMAMTGLVFLPAQSKLNKSTMQSTKTNGITGFTQRQKD